jgi:prepilin-type N-terminal cleavage/methylation domain-containing protein
MKISQHAFSLVEVMVAMALAGIVVASAVTSFKYSLDEQALAKREWLAFTVAQQQMEILASLQTTHPLLTGNVSSAIAAGTAADAICTDIPLGAQHFSVNGLGDVTTNGQFDVCFRITDGSPLGSKKNVRVVVVYQSGGARHVVLQTIR